MTSAGQELIEHFPITPKELNLIGDSKIDHNLLGFTVLLKHFQNKDGSPPTRYSPIVIVYLARQLGIVPERLFRTLILLANL